MYTYIKHFLIIMLWLAFALLRIRLAGSPMRCCAYGSPMISRFRTWQLSDKMPHCLFKTQPGFCGCGKQDIDTDGDKIPDCADACPDDPDKSSLGLCGCGKADVDQNHNYMADCFETASKQGQPCREYKDCNHEDEIGFCDSFIDFRCSTKCTSDDQCMTDDYFCRPDGRCAPKDFVMLYSSNAKEEYGEYTYITSGDLMLNTHAATACDFTIDWGDGTSDTITECSTDISNNPVHSYTFDEKYNEFTIKIRGTYDGFVMPTSDFQEKDIISFGPIGLGPDAFKSETSAVIYRFNSFSKIDIPDASKLTDGTQMFYGAQFTPNIEHWDVSYMTNMTEMFAGLYRYINSDYITGCAPKLGNWDVSNVTDMSNMFLNNISFNSDISKWNVSKVKNMNAMFAGSCTNIIPFNQPIGNWNVSNVEDMTAMFSYNNDFNQDISSWDVSHVKNMNSMFLHALSFSQPLDSWDVSNVTDMTAMFAGMVQCPGGSGYDEMSFCSSLSEWNTSLVTDMSYMFYGISCDLLDLSKWQVQNVTWFEQTFAYSKLNYNLLNWELKSVKQTRDMFKGSSISGEAYCQLINENEYFKKQNGNLGADYLCSAE